MEKMVECSIKFEKNPSAIFYNGSIINGIVEMEIEKPMTLRSIFLVINGEADVRWRKRRGSGKHRSTVHYKANDSYFTTTTYLYGSPDGIDGTINPGSHTYTFTYELPSDLPSSVEGRYGKIRYSAKVVFDRPWKFDKTYTSGFTVIKVTDLNLENPEIKLPSSLEIEKKFWSLSFDNKPLNIEVTVPQTGYVSGQHIPVGIKVCNTTVKSIQALAVSIVQTINSTSDPPRKKTKIEKIIVAKNFITSIKNLENEEFHIDLLVPPVPPTCNEATCRIVQVNYEVQVKAHIKRRHLSPVVKMPIIIGNVPLNLNDKSKIQSPQSSRKSLPNPSNLEALAALFGLPPPTYEEALYIQKVNMISDGEHPVSESNYIPSYPVFRFNSPASLPYV